MRRREFIALFGGAVTAWPFADSCAAGDENWSDRRPVAWARRQIRRKSYNSRRFRTSARRAWLHRRTEYCFRPEIRRWRCEQAQPGCAQELVDSQVDAMSSSATPAARAVKQATSSIPIIAIALADPVEDELACKLGAARGNVPGTGIFWPRVGVPTPTIAERDGSTSFSRRRVVAPSRIRRADHGGYVEGD